MSQLAHRAKSAKHDKRREPAASSDQPISTPGSITVTQSEKSLAVKSAFSLVRMMTCQLDN